MFVTKRHPLIYFLIASYSIIVSPTLAIAATWNGATTDWATPTNWDGGTLPTNSTDATINTTTNAPIINQPNAQSLNAMIGTTATGSLTITNGGTLTTANNAILGESLTGHGSVDLSQASTTWTISQNLTIGKRGNGLLTLSNGATLSDNIADVSSTTTGTGHAIITGAGTIWNNTSSLRIGYYGHGEVEVREGATINSMIGRVGDLTAVGIATVDGNNSRWTMTNSFIVGQAGKGTLTITNGGYVTNSDATIGNVGTSEGSVSVDDANSRWINTGQLLVGNYGKGTLSITDGGYVSNTQGQIGALSGSVGSVLIDGINSKWINSSNLRIGFTGNGTLLVTNGGYVSNNEGRVGDQSDTIGNVTINGTNTRWINTGTLYVGMNGAGTLSITHGAYTSNTWGYLGFGPSSSGTATVEGTGSQWVNSGETIIGRQGHGNLFITDGGHVTSGPVRIGYRANSLGKATLSGANSLWTANSTFLLGVDALSSGELTVQNEAHVETTGTSTLGCAFNSTATATITGTNSLWLNKANLIVGQYGAGTLTLSDSGQVISTNPLSIAQYAGSNGTINIGAGEGQQAQTAGILTTPEIIFGAGTGKIVFNHTNDDYVLSSKMTGAGTLLAVSGKTTLTGDLSGYTGSTFVRDHGELFIQNQFGGNLSVENSSLLSLTATVQGSITVASNSTVIANSFIGGSVTVQDGGTLQGNGRIGQNATVNTGGHVAPGNSIDTLSVTGNVSFASGSFFDIEVNPLGESDRLDATGSATISGGTVNVIPYTAGLYRPGLRYTILHADGGVTGQFDTLNSSINTLFTESRLNYTSNDVYVDVLRNGTSFASVATTKNDIAIARAIDQAPITTPFVSALIMQTDSAAARSAFQSLSGSFYANIKGDSAQAMLVFPDPLPYKTSPTASFFLRPYSQTRERNANGSLAFRAEENGLLWGAQKALNADQFLTLWVSYGQNDYAQPHATNAHATAKQARIGGTWALSVDDFSFSLSGHYGYAALKSHRVVSFIGYDDRLTAAMDAHALAGQAEIAHTTHLPTSTRLTPFARLAYGASYQGMFKETGGDSRLIGKADTSTQGNTTLGLRLNQDFPLSALSATIGWQHRLSDDTAERSLRFTSTPSFMTTGAPESHDHLIFETALTAPLLNTSTAPFAADIDLGYKALFSARSQSSTLFGTLRVKL